VTALWSKVGRDVWHVRTRAVLVVLAIAIGLAGFFAVLSTYAILRRELNRGYLATNPASAVFVTDRVDESLLSAIVARDDVDDADARRVIRGRIRAGDKSWRRLMLFVVRNFQEMRISTIAPDGGKWPPHAGEVLIERDAFQVAKVQIGDNATIQIGTGPEQRLHIAGRVHDAGQAQARMENSVYGYITPETLAQVAGSPILDRLYVSVSGDRFDETHVRRVASDIKTWLDANGHPVRRMDVPAPGEHPHALIMGLLLALMAVFGLLALGLSGVIVMNLQLATMANERRQIGVMKAVGGTRGRIASVYLAEAALLGVAAILLASPAGIALGRALSNQFALLLNFDLASLTIPAWVYLLVVIVGLLVPLASAAYPVVSATAMTVREAVSASGVDPGRFGSGRVDRLLCGVDSAGRPWLLGVRNSARRRMRTGLTLTTLTIAGTLFITALSLRASIMATLDRMFGPNTYGSDRRYALDQHMLMIYVFLIVAAGVLAAVGGLGLMTAMSLNVLDRRRELGVLRAIGGTPAMVGTIVVIEAVFVTVLAWAIAVGVSWPLTFAIGRLLAVAMFRGGLDIWLAPAAVVIWLGFSAALALVSSLSPAVSASRRSVREAVSYE
jgi:putative ABC transport system permease protein